jgi:hypothetical protein
MPGNPTECREHAKRCLALAAEASSPLAKAQFQNLAQTWMDLANEIDRTKRLLAHWAVIDDKAKTG